MAYSLPEVPGLEDLPSPSLLLLLDRIAENVRRMLKIAGGPGRLRPHVKTHKLPQLVKLLADQGVTRAKCSTLAEAGMAAGAGARDVLLAGFPAGGNLRSFLELQMVFPEVKFSTLVDDLAMLEQLSAAATAAGHTLRLWVDLDVGQHRTGIVPGKAAELWRAMVGLPGIEAAGLHAYDGHLHQGEVVLRRKACEEAFVPVWELVEQLRIQGHPVPAVVAGGTPTFPFHARDSRVECSPGTCVLWDAGYDQGLPDLDFLPAAFLMARVISRPGQDRICLDLGHKAVASEMAPPRVVFPELPEARAVMHSEEHLVLETPRAKEFPPGTVLLGIPWHVCPTVALHSHVYAVSPGGGMEEWPVTARARRANW